MSAMQGGDNVDPMQIMMMTQLLKDEDENADGMPEKGSKYNFRFFFSFFKLLLELWNFRGWYDVNDDDEWNDGWW